MPRVQMGGSWRSANQTFSNLKILDLGMLVGWVAMIGTWSDVGLVSRSRLGGRKELSELHIVEDQIKVRKSWDLTIVGSSIVTASKW